MRRAAVEVGSEEPAEEHHLAGDEQEHAEQRGRHADLPTLDLHDGGGTGHGGRLGAHDSASVSSATAAGTRCSRSCLCRRSKTGRSERIGGSVSKLYGGGGEVVAHSSVFPSQGSSPTCSPLMKVATRFRSSGMMLIAIVKAPTVEMRLSTV